MNITILGPGAIGSLWANKLRFAGHKVSLWGRDNAGTLTLQLDDQAPYPFPHRNLQALANADLLLVTLKAWQVESALTELRAHIDKDIIIVLMHNGMGTAQVVCELFADNPIVVATTTHGAYKPTRQQVIHTGVGNTQLGGFNRAGEQCQFLEQVFEHALPEVSWNPNIQTVLWNKLAVNCAINPLTAIYQCNNGQLVQLPFQITINAVLDEIIAVMQAEGLTVEFEQLQHMVNQVITRTKANFSSMHQDVYHQRKTEIDFINGYLVSVAKKHQIATPENDKLYQAIKQIEQGWTAS